MTIVAGRSLEDLSTNNTLDFKTTFSMSSGRSSNVQLDPTAPLLESFRILAIQQGWKKKTDTYKSKRRAFLADAVEDGFSNMFGGNTNSLRAWQSLCQTIGVPERKEGEDVPVLTSISACQRALNGVYVNLVDLVDAGTAGTVISKKFSSQKELAGYICRTGKVFPRDRAKSNPLLRKFLIVVDGGGKRRKSKRAKPT